MKIYGKQVFVGTKKLCVEYTSKVVGSFDDCYVGSNEYKGEDIEKNVIFFRDKNGYFIDINDIDGSGFLALNFYGAVPRYRKTPNKTTDIYVDDLKTYLPECDQETLYEVKDLIYTLKNSKGITIE